MIRVSESAHLQSDGFVWYRSKEIVQIPVWRNQNIRVRHAHYFGSLRTGHTYDRFSHCGLLIYYSWALTSLWWISLALASLRTCGQAQWALWSVCPPVFLHWCIHTQVQFHLSWSSLCGVSSHYSLHHQVRPSSATRNTAVNSKGAKDKTHSRVWGHSLAALRR